MIRPFGGASAARWTLLALFGAVLLMGGCGGEEPVAENLTPAKPASDEEEPQAPEPSEPPTPSADVVTFTFAPPDGTEYVETTRKETVIRTGEREQNRIEEQRSHATYEKTDEGYVVKVVGLMPQQMRVMAKAYEDKLGGELEFHMSFEVDPNGVLVAVHGLEDQIEKWTDIFPPFFMKLLESFLDRTVQNVQMDWQARLRMMPHGSELTVGERREFTGELPILGGETLTVDGWLELVERVPGPDGSWVRLRAGFSSVDQKIASILGSTLLGGVLQNLAALAGEEDNPKIREMGQVLGKMFSNGALHSESEILIDADTLLLRSYAETRVMEMDIKPPNQEGGHMVMTEKTTITFDAPPQEQPDASAR